MKIKYVLFDLDGTLLPMSLEVWVKAYLGALIAKLATRGVDSAQKITEATMLGIAQMTGNDGRDTNENVFWKIFNEKIPNAKSDYASYYDDFYENEYEELRSVCGYSKEIVECFKKIKLAGFRVSLATSPVFPRIATVKRLGWAGFSPEDFDYISSYENSSYSKPNPLYYKEFLSKIGALPEECLMVGNDTIDDLSAQEMGIKVFLLTDCLENRNNTDISSYPHGDACALLSYLQEIK